MKNNGGLGPRITNTEVMHHLSLILIFEWGPSVTINYTIEMC